MIVNPVVYGGGVELCNGYLGYYGQVYYFDGENYCFESGVDIEIVAAKNSVLVFFGATSLSDSRFVGLSTLVETNNGRMRVLRVDSDFRIG